MLINGNKRGHKNKYTYRVKSAPCVLRDNYEIICGNIARKWKRFPGMALIQSNPFFVGNEN